MGAVARPHTTRAAHWLVDLTIGGVRFYFSDADVDVPFGALVVEYDAGALLDEVTLGDGPTTAKVTIGPGAGGVSWALLAARGANFAAGTATIRMWYEGTDKADAEVLVNGRLVKPTFGTDERPLVFSVDSSQWDTSDTTPGSASRIDETTWPVTSSPYPLYPAPKSYGATYPDVYGYPGRGAFIPWFAETPIDDNVVPAYPAEIGPSAHTYLSSIAIFAGHAVGAAQVSVLDVSANRLETLDVVIMQDKRGVTVSGFRADFAGVLRILPDHEYWVSIPAIGGGGYVDQDLGSPVRLAGAVLEHKLRRAGVTYDRGRLAVARTRGLDRLRLDFVDSEPSKPEDWVAGHLGALVPLLRREGPDGVWWELWRYDATAADAELHLNGDSEALFGVAVNREGDPEWGDTTKVANDITLRYLKTRSGYAKTLRLVGVAEPVVANGELGSYLCAVSLATYGPRPLVITTDILADDSDATTALAIIAAERCLSRRSIVISGGPELGVLAPNSVVTYSEAGLYLDHVPALVTSVSRGLLEVGATLELLERPDRRGRSAAVAAVAPASLAERIIALLTAGGQSGPYMLHIADDASVIHASGAVAQWRDSSGNSRHLSVLTGSAPAYVSLAWGGTNPQPAVLFNGGGLRTAANHSFGDLTVMTVFRDAAGVPGYYERLVDHAFDTGYWLGRQITQVNSWGGGVIVPASPNGQFVTVNDGASHLFGQRRSGTLQQFLRDGTVPSGAIGSATVTTSNPVAVGDTASGGAFPATNLYMGLHLVMARAITDAEHIALYALLRGFYGLP